MGNDIPGDNQIPVIFNPFAGGAATHHFVGRQKDDFGCMQGTSIMAVWPQSILRTLPFECFPAFTVLVLCHMIQGGVYNNSATVSNTASYTMILLIKAAAKPKYVPLPESVETVVSSYNSGKT